LTINRMAFYRMAKIIITILVMFNRMTFRRITPVITKLSGVAFSSTSIPLKRTVKSLLCRVSFD
jgi:hypothetical protein